MDTSPPTITDEMLRIALLNADGSIQNNNFLLNAGGSVRAPWQKEYAHASQGMMGMEPADAHVFIVRRMIDMNVNNIAYDVVSQYQANLEQRSNGVDPWEGGGIGEQEIGDGEAGLRRADGQRWRDASADRSDHGIAD